MKLPGSENEVLKDMVKDVYSLGKRPLDYYSKTELELLFQKDPYCVFFTVLVDQVERDKDLLTCPQLEKYVLNVVSATLDIGSPEERRKKLFLVLHNNIVWLTLPDAPLCSYIEKTLAEDSVPNGSTPGKILGAFGRVQKELFRTKPLLAKKIFEMLCVNILKKCRNGKYLSNALQISSEFEKPLFIWNKNLFDKLLCELRYYDKEGEYLVPHLFETSLEVHLSREEIYKDIISQLLSGQGAEIFLERFAEFQNAGVEKNNSKYLIDLPCVYNDVLDFLAITSPQDEKTVRTVMRSKRLPEKSKKKFLEIAFLNRTSEKKVGGHCALLNILCFKWQEGTPERTEAEHIIQTCGSGWGDTFNLFLDCASDGAFTYDDFFLKVILSLYESTPDLQKQGLSSGINSFENFVLLRLGLDNLLSLLIASLEKSQETGEVFQSLELHEKLIKGPLKHCLKHNSSERDVKNDILEIQYLNLLGVLKQTYSSEPEENFGFVNELAIG